MSQTRAFALSNVYAAETTKQRVNRRIRAKANGDNK